MLPDRDARASNVHPDLRHIARWFPRATLGAWTARLVDLVMHMMPVPALPRDVEVENVIIGSRSNPPGVRVRIYRAPTAAPAMPVLVWLHGGGYVIGCPEMDDRRCAQFVRELGLAVVSVDYRRAPRYPFPAALRDCYAVLEWVSADPLRVGLDPERVAIGGASAGGGLAASLAQLAHDRHEVRASFQLLVYPMLDDRTTRGTGASDRHRVVWNSASNRFGWESYLGERSRAAGEVPAYAVPARRKDLSGLPPAWIGVGTLDLFLDEDLAYAHRLRECGVSCELTVVPGAFHGFDAFTQSPRVVRDFRRAQVSALRKGIVDCGPRL